MLTEQQSSRQMLLVAELIGTLESLIIYCKNEDVANQARERLVHLLFLPDDITFMNKVPYQTLKYIFKDLKM